MSLFTIYEAGPWGPTRLAQVGSSASAGLRDADSARCAPLLLRADEREPWKHGRTRTEV